MSDHTNKPGFRTQVDAATDPSTSRLRGPVVEAYKKDVDRTLLPQNLTLTVQHRFEKLESFVEFARELREAGMRPRGEIGQS